MLMSLEAVEGKLRTSDVVLHSAVNSNPPVVGDSPTVPAGSRLRLAGGVGLVMGTSAALQVDRALIVDGNLENRGTVTNTSMNTLDAKGDYVGSGTLNNKGRVAANGSFMQGGGSSRTIGQGWLEMERKAVVDNAVFDLGAGTTLFRGDSIVRNADGEFGDNLCVGGMLSLEDDSILTTGGFYGRGTTIVEKQDRENMTYEELSLEGGEVLAERRVKGVTLAKNYELGVQNSILERSDDRTPLITDTGILEMDGEEYKVEELTESTFGSEETEMGWVLTDIVQEQKKQAEVYTSIPSQVDVEKLPDVNEEEKELQGEENLLKEGEPEEGRNQPEGGSPEAGGDRPEEGEPEEGGNQPEEGEPEKGGNQPEEGKPDEGGSRPEEGEPEEGGSQPGEGVPEEGGNRSEGGRPREGGNQSEEGSPEEGTNRPEEGRLEEGGNQPEEGGPEESGNRPEEGSPEEGANRPGRGGPGEGTNRSEEGSPEEGANQLEGGSPEGGRNQPEEGGPEEGVNRPVEGIPEKGKNQSVAGEPEEYGNPPG